MIPVDRRRSVLTLLISGLVLIAATLSAPDVAEYMFTHWPPRRAAHALMSASAIEAIAAQLSDSAAVCVNVRRSRELETRIVTSDSMVLARLRGTRQAFRYAACPRTYVTMNRPMNWSPPPPGYIDPHIIDLHDLRRVGADSAIMAVTEWQGTGFTTYRCELSRRDGRWRAACGATGMGVT